MSQLSDLATTLKVSLGDAQAVAASAASLVAKHEALIAAVEQADLAPPTIADLQALVARMKTA